MTGRLAVRMALAAMLCVLVGCSRSKGKPAEAKRQEAGKVTLFFTTEIKGTVEPCGCNSDPLGDLARTAELIADARAGKEAVLYLDGGSLLYSALPIPEAMQAQEALKSKLIAQTFAKHLQPAAIGLGPFDLAAGPDDVRPARMAANLAKDAPVPVAPPQVVEAGGVKVGVFGVVAPAAVAELGLTASDPAAAAKEAVEQLRGQGAQVVVGLAHMPKADAVALARAVEGIDFLLVGQQAPANPDQVSIAPDKVGDTWLFQPADRGQVVSRLDLSFRGAGGFADAIGEARAESAIAAIEARLPELREKIAEWEKDPSADPAFLQTKKQELAELKARAEALRESPLAVPERGSYFTFQQIEIDKGLPCSPPVVAAKKEYDKAAGAANVAAAAGNQPPPVPPGQAGYVGSEECSMCHADAFEFWKTTRHFGAWETLEVQNKQFNLECIGCHVTGWQKPGGSTLAVNEHLRDVQCETCHGPGSIHIDAEGPAQRKSIQRTPPEPLCQGCHNEEHSDTFDYKAYLRDVTGPGHGEVFRNQLGDGPTGHELRSAALEAAGKKIGKGCPK